MWELRDWLTDQWRAKYTSDLGLYGADDRIRTRDPHLGKETHLVRRDGCTPLSSLSRHFVRPVRRVGPSPGIYV